MSRFRFKLERLSRVREIEEQMALAAWATAEREARASELRLAAAREEVERAREEARRYQAAPRLDLSRLLLVQGTLPALLACMTRARDRLRACRAQADRLQAAWRERDRDRRGLARLEDKARTRHLAHEEQHERASLDEAASRRAAFGSGSVLSAETVSADESERP